MTIKVIDLFAGCGGIGEGFSAFATNDQRKFDVVLSVESDKQACDTLMLRKFFWEFDEVPDDYYQYIKGLLSKEDLKARHPFQWTNASSKVVCNELGDNNFTDQELPKLIQNSLGGAKHWILVGGPPCQAYSQAGLARNRNNNNYVAENDGRHFLYRQYLKVLAQHAPPLFLMENVPGILNAKVSGKSIFPRILEDLENPQAALNLAEEALEPSLGFIDFPFVRFGLVARLVALTLARLLHVSRLELGLVARWPG